jgi:predicted nuclease of predicted toxin-antitoxin system
MAKAEDVDVLEHASDEQRVLITADTDFGTILTESGRSDVSVILYRHPSRRPEDVLRLLTKTFPR